MQYFILTWLSAQFPDFSHVLQIHWFFTWWCSLGVVFFQFNCTEAAKWFNKDNIGCPINLAKMKVIAPMDAWSDWLQSRRLWMVQISSNLISRYWIWYLASKQICCNCKQDGEMKAFPFLPGFLFTTSRQVVVF